MQIYSLATLSTFLLLLYMPGTCLAQHPQPERSLRVAGQPGQAAALEINGRAYVSIEELARLIHGSVTFEAETIILTVPELHGSSSDNESVVQPSGDPKDQTALSREFMRAGIEEFASLREWASTLAYALENGYELNENWVSNYSEEAAHNLRLASTAVSTEGDRHALQLLTNEFDSVRHWSDKLIQERKSLATAKYAISDSALREDPLSQKIVTCGHFLARMLGSGTFQDEPTCH